MMARLALAGAPASKARGGLVLVHGRGASAADILGLGQALGLPELALAAPEAPGNSWWPTSFLAPTAQMEDHVQAGIAAIDAAIAALTEDGLPREKIALGGFSQGACLALEYAARKGGVSAVFGLSGALVGTGDAGGEALNELYGYADKTFDYSTDLSGVPVVFEVHERDPHIPLARVRRSVEVFDALGADTSLSVMPGPGHGIGEAGITAMRAALNR
ncbi:phospholipase [Rhodobacterales bacterium HKCCE3408]|nr:phospholipase [Rhodobacterales bacterium HKCCE3408]